MPKSVLHIHPKAQEVFESLLIDFKNSNFEQITDLSIKNLETLGKKDIKTAFETIYEAVQTAEANNKKLIINNENTLKL